MPLSAMSSNNDISIICIYLTVKLVMMTQYALDVKCKLYAEIPTHFFYFSDLRTPSL